MTGPRSGALSAVSSLLRADPVLPSLLSSADATLAVAMPAQAVLVAALAHFTERSPIVVVTANGVDADRVADDLACLLPESGAKGADSGAGAATVGVVRGPVAVLPAWETLPFERVSPEVETMGRRLALLWGLMHPVDDPLFLPPRVIVAPIRALLQRLGPMPSDAPMTVRPGQQLSADELLTGRLRHLDFEDRRLCRAVFGSPITSQTVDIVAEVALRHPQTEAFAWLLDDAPLGTLPPHAARRLIDTGRPRIAKAAMRHLPLDLLVSSDNEYAAACGDAWLAACPGLTASERPPLPWDRLGPLPGPPPLAAARVWYPEQLLRLELTNFAQAPGWRITLPRTVEDIRHNAKIMCNCTAGLIEDVLEGSVFLVIVHDPEGRRYNVAITRTGRRFAVGDINSWANGGIAPLWIRPTFLEHLNKVDEYAPWENQVSGRRRPTPNRDRRRFQARAARQRR